jgi:hypothetical protein
MKLTEKDKEFLERLRLLVESKDLWVDMRQERPSYMVLRGTYGQKIHQTFRMTRQGVRWRFYRLFNDIYVSAFETILFIEKSFGTDLRDNAIRISRQRHQLRQEIGTDAYQSADTLQSRNDSSRPPTGEHGTGGQEN